MSSAEGKSPSVESRWVRNLRRVSFVLVGLLWCAALALVVWVHLNERWGTGMRLVVSTAAIALCSLVSLAWFAALAPVPRRIRLGVTVGVLAVCGLLAVALRLEEVSGGLRPRFVFRWAPRADQTLEPLGTTAPPETEPVVDLGKTGVNDYPRFLGADQRQSIDGVRFDTDWSKSPPRCVWKQSIGAGWSSFVAVNGYAVTQEQRSEQELVTCYEIATGKLMWANGIEARHETKMGGVGPRATPCIDQGRVYALGATGVFRCLDGATGRELWQHNLVAETGVRDDLQAIAWGRAGSPLIADEFVVIPVGGPVDGPKTSLRAYDKVTGAEVWNAGTRQLSYASPVRATLLGRDQIIAVLQDFACGFDTQTGELLWEHPWPGRSNANASVSNPVPLNGDQVFLSKGYAEGAELIQLRADANGRWQTESVWKQPVIMKSKLSNVVAYDGHIYGLDDVILECIEIDSGRKRWKKGRFGYGQLMRAGNTLIVLSEHGELAAVAASPDEFRELGRFPALEGKCWNHLCLYGPYLLVRNATEAACYELPNWSRDPADPS